MIPKQFHWVWIGDDPLPDPDRQWMSSWKDKHPDWRCTVWAQHPGLIAPEGFEVKPLLPLANQKYYDGIETWVHTRAALAAKSDIVRYEIVAHYGGIYLDTDVECFQNIEGVLDNVRLFRAEEWGPNYGNWLFGGCANHPQLWTIVRELGPHLLSKKAEMNVLEATGPGYFCRQIDRHADCVIFPQMLFNPLCAFDDPSQVTKWPEVSLGNHRYDGKWYDRTKNKPPQEFLK